MFLTLCCRDSIGSSAVIGDLRWAGQFGVNADFVAKGHCAVEFIPTEGIQVTSIFAVIHALIDTSKPIHLQGTNSRKNSDSEQKLFFPGYFIKI